MNVLKLLKDSAKKFDGTRVNWDPKSDIGKTWKEFKDLITIEYNGKIEMALNPGLILQQGIGVRAIKVLRKLHIKRLQMFEKMEKLSTREELHPYVKKLELLEFAMQRAWKFKQDRDFHTWWYQAPHCNCPKMDNVDSFGVGQRIYSSDCILHWDSAKVEMKESMKTKEKSKAETVCNKCSYHTGEGNNFYKCLGSKGCLAAYRPKKRK